MLFFVKKCIFFGGFHKFFGESHGNIEIVDGYDNGQSNGEIVSIIYKGDHYQVIIRTDEDEDFVVDTEYTWNEFDKVSIKIPKECIKMTLKREAKEYVKD